MSDIAPRLPEPQRDWKRVVWVGGGCLVAVLAALQVLLVFVLYMNRLTNQMERGMAIPAWVPPYPGAHALRDPIGFPRLSGVEGLAFLATADPPETVIDFYSQKMRAQGFVVDPPTLDGNDRRLHAAARDGRDLTVTSGGQEGSAWIKLIY
jgi:hypothetical protein